MGNIRDSPFDIAAFTVLLSISAGLIIAAIITIDRHYLVSGGIRGNGSASGTGYYIVSIRWLALICCCLQFLLFLGYLTNEFWPKEIAWDLWVPFGTLALMLLGIQIARSNVDFSDHSGIIRKCKIYAFCLWAFGAVTNTLGGVLGFAQSQTTIQIFCYATWKLSVALSLMVVNYVLYAVRKRTIVTRNATEHCMHTGGGYSAENETKKPHLFDSAIVRMRNLFICLSLEILFLLSNSIKEYVFFFELALKVVDSNISYTETPTLFIALYTFPTWTFTQLVLLVYSAIPRSRMQTQMLSTAQHSINRTRTASSHRSRSRSNLRSKKRQNKNVTFKDIVTTTGTANEPKITRVNSDSGGAAMAPESPKSPDSTNGGAGAVDDGSIIIVTTDDVHAISATNTPREMTATDHPDPTVLMAELQSQTFAGI